MNKKRALRIHAKRRALDRYGVALNRFQLKDLVDCIKEGNGRYIKHHSKRVSEWELKYEGKTFRVLYDTSRHEIITFLPLRVKKEKIAAT